MIVNILQVLIVVSLFFIIKYLSYRWVNQKNYPEWLRYKPFTCFRCLSFWLLILSYGVIGLVFSLYEAMIGGAILAIMDTIAYGIDQKNNTISLDEYDDRFK